MLNAEHLLENAVCDLEKYEVHEAYKQFMESPCNIELAENAGIRLDDVWVMAVYCCTTIKQDWKEKWEDEAARWIPVTERLPDVNKTNSDYEETTVIVAIAGCKKSHPMVYERTRVRGEKVYRWKWVWDRLYDWNEITHWMPFPEAKKEG